MTQFTDQFRPSYIAQDIDTLTPDLFTPGGQLESIAGLAFDVDGTIVAHHEKEVPLKSKETLYNLADAGLALYIISNAYGKRVNQLEAMFGEKEMGMWILTPASVAGDDNPKRHRKPSPEMLQLAMADVDGDVMMIGDQLFKDVVSANRAGAPSLLVPRRGEGDDWRVRAFQRPAEVALRGALHLPIRAQDYPTELRKVA